MKKNLYLLFVSVVLFSCNKEDKVRNQFAGAWEIEKITVSHFANGADSVSREYKDCGTWTLFDNGFSGYTFNESYLIMTEPVPVIFNGNLQLKTNGRYEGFVDWGGVDADNKRILFEIGSGGSGTDMAFTVEKISRNKFVFFHFTMDPQNNDHIKELQRFELKRTNQ